MKNISVLIKPSSSLCNIKCSYCFYNTIAKERKVESYGFMSLKTLENTVKKSLEISQGKSCNFSFQGGEPTLIGLEFFEKFIEFVEKYNKDTSITFSIQTNGINLDINWAKFFKKHNFLVGLSLDGKKIIHDSRRLDKNNSGTFDRVIESKKILDRYQVSYNSLTVVDNKVAKNPKETYEFFKSKKIKYTQYIPYLEPLNSKDPKEVLNVKNYESFLKILFDCWYNDFFKGNYTSIQYFDNLVNILLKKEDNVCGMNGVCSIQNVIEADGSVYPCDFYVYEKWKLGNINEDSFEEMFNSKKVIEFIGNSYDVSNKCRNCKWFNLCRGGCRRRRNQNSLNILCEAYEGFFEYSILKLLHVAKIISNLEEELNGY